MTVVCFEGLDGAGKTTALRTLYTLLRERGVEPFVCWRFAFLSDSSSRLMSRARWLGDSQIPTDSLLAAYYDDLERLSIQIIAPLVRARRIILMDRYLWSFVSYAHVLHGLEVADILNGLRQRRVAIPDVTIHLVAEQSRRSQTLHARSRTEVWDTDTRQLQLQRAMQQLSECADFGPMLGVSTVEIENDYLAETLQTRLKGDVLPLLQEYIGRVKA